MEKEQEQGVIRKGDLQALIEALRPRYRVAGPVAEKDGVALAEIDGRRPLLFDQVHFKVSAKKFFLPPRETLCTFEGNCVRETLPDEKPLFLLGLKPCDARALLQLDKVFRSAGLEDPYYLRKREKAVLIALACLSPAKTCFCSSVNGGPLSKEGSDALAYDLGDRLLLEIASEKGRTFLQEFSSFFRSPSKADTEARDRQAAQAPEMSAGVQLDGLKEKLQNSYQAPIWNALAERCLGCGVCSYLCPTCHCFDITDETEGEGGRRVRTWDSCQQSLFTLHASGHNPRPSPTERVRQRLMHKFLYTVENFGETFCVGCGRCVRYCPVNLDLRETIAALNA